MGVIFSLFTKVDPEKPRKICVSCNKSFVYTKEIFEPHPSFHHYNIVHGKKDTCYMCCYLQHIKEPNYIGDEHL